MTALNVIEPTVAASLVAESTVEGGQSLAADTADASAEGKDEQQGKLAF